LYQYSILIYKWALSLEHFIRKVKIAVEAESSPNVWVLDQRALHSGF
jgi:hypothetical protein